MKKSNIIHVVAYSLLIGLLMWTLMSSNAYSKLNEQYNQLGRYVVALEESNYQYVVSYNTLLDYSNALLELSQSSTIEDVNKSSAKIKELQIKLEANALKTEELSAVTKDTGFIWKEVHSNE